MTDLSQLLSEARAGTISQLADYVASEPFLCAYDALRGIAGQELPDCASALHLRVLVSAMTNLRASVPQCNEALNPSPAVPGEPQGEAGGGEE